jgi:hypothetical protein
MTVWNEVQGAKRWRCTFVPGTVVHRCAVYDQWFNRRPSRTRTSSVATRVSTPHGRSCCMSVPR